MAFMKKKIRDTLAVFFTRRKGKQSVSTACCPASGDAPGPQEALLFDAITLESIFSLRGQNPFPEEESEIGFMNNTLREQSLHSC
ncbi:MAG: hypothetical protein JXA71_05030 [Chitinispirillaceae bacterium]|nr:hypothetical protein [Chitinispirillaceae bacterium]